jgi:N6-adenosine-specific RNA methylase IME4
MMITLNGDAVPFHPLAGLFPLLPPDDLRVLRDDIAANGLQEPVVMFEGQILDGRNRFLACQCAEVTVRFIDYAGTDPLGFVISKNLHRRHLDASQRAMVAAKVATLRQGARTDLASIKARSQSDAARILNIGRSPVQQAHKVLEKGGENLIEAVQTGKIAVSIAAKLAGFPADIQTRAVAAPERAAHIVKQATRENREADLGAKQTALPDKRYGVILADPEWRFEPWSRNTGMDRAADNHYPTSPMAEIEARDVASVAAPDCILFLWATAPMLPHALDVMRAWGFAYRTHAVWSKDCIGMGYWFRSNHELLLVGTRGNIPAPAPGMQWRSVIDAPVGAHSAKPEVVLEMIEEYFPTLPKIELNRRGPARPGWDAWGNEVGQD